MTARGDVGATYYRWRARWRASRWHPVRLLSTGFRRSLALLALMWAIALLDDVSTAVNLALTVVALMLIWTLPEVWTRQVDEARAEPTSPPEPVYTSILAAPYNPSTWDARLVAGWDQVYAGVVEQGRAYGIDVDDPYTLTVMAAALVMAEQYAAVRPITPDGAIHVHETAWKVRLRDLARWDDDT